jgi:hypothetical protein
MHRARFAGRVKRGAMQRMSAMRCNDAPDRDHLAMRGRVMRRASEIAPARQHRAVAYDHGAEWKVSLPRFVQRHAHETLVFNRNGVYGRSGGLRKRPCRHHCSAGESRNK